MCDITHGGRVTSQRRGQVKVKFSSSLNHGLLQHYFGPFQRQQSFDCSQMLAVTKTTNVDPCMGMCPGSLFHFSALD